MAKLYFRYGAVGSAKTLNLLAVAHNYEQQGKRVLVAKPIIDTRFGNEEVASRAGLRRTADFFFSVDDADTASTITSLLHDSAPELKVACILIDEAQFLTVGQVNELRRIASNDNVPVICYGLRTDFRTNLFPGSARLMELADAIEEVKTTCHFCTKKATFNLKHINGKATTKGEQVELGAEERYLPACYACYAAQVMPE
jgi:thymidine kinase